MERLLKIINYSPYSLEVTQELSALLSLTHTHTHGENIYQ